MKKERKIKRDRELGEEMRERVKGMIHIYISLHPISIINRKEKKNTLKIY
jgi:hypothetical protein